MARKINVDELLSKDDADRRIESLNFEEGLQLLEDLVAKVESGSLSLDSAIHSYEKGVLLVERLRTLLSGAEEKLKVLQRPGGER